MRDRASWNQRWDEYEPLKPRTLGGGIGGFGTPKGIIAGYRAHASLVSEVGISPVEHHSQPVPETDQEEEVDY